LNDPHPPFGINRATASEDGVRIEVWGELDLSTSPRLAEALRRELDGGNSVTLDLSKVTFIDSTGLNVLITAARACEENGCTIALGPDLPAQIRRVFEITGIDGVFPLASD
jgi:anti-sigma B factor antagonist